MSKVVKVKTVCDSCGGTGLYSGMCEQKGTAVICYKCNGTGCDEIEYVPFEKIKQKKGVKRVFARTCGYVHGPDDVTVDGDWTIRFSEAGCTYKEWQDGVAPKPVKELYCPYVWDNKGIGNEPTKYCKTCLGGRISDCKRYQTPDMQECWAIYEGKKN